MNLKKALRLSEEIYDRLIEDLCFDTVKERIKTEIQLTDEEIQLYQQVTNGTMAPDHILVHKFNVSITVQLASCLQDRSWLNDEIINFYFSLLGERCDREMQQENGRSGPKCAFLNSFFYTKLSENGYNYDGVRRWTKRRKIDIFSCDLVFFPVNCKNVHWCLGVINVGQQRIEYYDSMGGQRGSFFPILRQYLIDEFRDKKKDDLDIDEWEDICPSDIPHQTNGYDCGMFVCKFADYRSDGLDCSFNQTNIQYFRKRMLVEICRGTVI